MIRKIETFAEREEDPLLICRNNIFIILTHSTNKTKIKERKNGQKDSST